MSDAWENTAGNHRAVNNAKTYEQIATAAGFPGRGQFFEAVSGSAASSSPGANFDQMQYARDTAHAMIDNKGGATGFIDSEGNPRPPTVGDVWAANTVARSDVPESSFESPFEIQSQYRHQPAEVYDKLSTERYGVQFEQQPGPPVSGENKTLRKMSPFTIRVIWPHQEIGSGRAGSSGGETPTQYSTAHHAGSGTLGSTLTGQQNLEVVATTDALLMEGQMQKTGLLTPYDLADVYGQIAAVAATPPLVLLINPASMNIQYQKVQNYQTMGRNGYIFQSWGEAQPTISFSGRIGAFYAAESSMESSAWATQMNPTFGVFPGTNHGKTTTPTGVQEASRRDSAAFQNLMSLIRIYRNNGLVRDRIGGSRANHAVGSVVIEYDGWYYEGHFEKLEFGFNEQNNLGGVNYSFDFTVSRMEDRRAPSYHVAQMQAGAAALGGSSADASITSALATSSLPGPKEQWWNEDWEPGATPWVSMDMPSYPDGSAMSPGDWWKSVNEGPSWEGRSGMKGWTYEYGTWDKRRRWESEEEYQERLREQAQEDQDIPEAPTNIQLELPAATEEALDRLTDLMGVLEASFGLMSPEVSGIIRNDVIPAVMEAAEVMAAEGDGSALVTALGVLSGYIQGSGAPDINKASLLAQLNNAKAAAAAVGGG